MAPSFATQALDSTLRWGMDNVCPYFSEKGPSTDSSLLQSAEAACANAASRSAQIQSPYPDSYNYCGVNANDMYYQGGNGAWGDAVRGCLTCMDDYGVEPHDAHLFCYENATNRVGSFWSTARGYGEAISRAGSDLVESGVQWTSDSIQGMWDSVRKFLK